MTLLYRLVLGSFVLALVAIDVAQAAPSSFGWDFRAFYAGGHSYLHLHSPYISGSLADLTSRQNFVYPIPTAALFAPISLLPYHVAAALWICLSAALLMAALYLVGVRDVRCFLAVLISAPTLDGVEIGTISPILAFLVALLWRYRNRTWTVAVALSLLVLTKLFLWPLGVWLIATRRIKSAVLACAITLAAVVVAAAPLGLGVVTHYPHLLKTVSAFEAPSSLSLVALGAALTGSSSVGLALSVVVGLALLVGVAWRGRRNDETGALGLAVLAGLALTPIVWNHYLVVLFIPLAIMRPRFSPIWLSTAWVIGAVGGSALGGLALAAAVAVVWIIAFGQAGVLRRLGALPRSLVSRPLRRLGAAGALWAVLVLVLIALLGVVPAVAALRSTTKAEASGTATIRLLHDGSVCLSALTSGVAGPAHLQLVDVTRRTVVLDRRLEGTRLDACDDRSSDRAGENLADAFAANKTRLSLRFVSASGRVLLAGRVVRPSDLTK